MRNFASLYQVCHAVRHVGRRMGLSLLLAGVGCVAAFGAETAPVQAVAEGAAAGEVKMASRAEVSMTPAVSEHPLMPVIRWAEKERPKLAQIEDYTALLTKQECINGEIQEAQVMEIKVRHKPFSVYTKFRFPRGLNGQEAIYVEGQNDGKIIAHGTGVQRAAGTLKLDPESHLVMKGQKYPITKLGILKLIDELLEVGYQDSKFGECEVKYYEENIKVADRDCVLIQVVHPYPRKNFRFYEARIYVDKELNIPIRYESYDWPKQEGGSPMLIEAYTYQNLKMNVGLSDYDFNPKNTAYKYP